MFTGIVQTIGCITRWERQGRDARMTVASPALNFSRIAHGDSIAVNGVCLTVAARGDEALTMDVSAETLARTTCGCLSRGDRVNLEIALTPQSVLGGHLVTGHVDGMGKVISRNAVGGSVRLMVATPPNLVRYIAEKGAICMDGVSLTVNTIHGAKFGVNLIPYTLRTTTLKRCVCGTRVNLEVDLIARYLERLILSERAKEAGAGGMTREVLARYGFMEFGS